MGEVKNPESPKRIIDRKLAVRKINRIAYEIVESNYGERELILVGVANKGHKLAKLLARKLREISDISILLTSVKLDKRNPLNEPVEMGDTSLGFQDKTVIIIDDVGNTGRTLFYAMQPLAAHLPRKIQAAVLVDRMHKSYPINVDFVGTQLATTLNEEVIVEFTRAGTVEGAYLH